MANRPASYVAFKDTEYRLTIDLRVHAPTGTSKELLLNELALTYAELVTKIVENDKWKGPHDS